MSEDPVATYWAQVQALFEAVMDLPPDDQLRELHERTVDTVLREEVIALLHADRGSAGLIDLPLEQVAARLIDDADGYRGRLVGPYRLQSLLGEGGMGVVYRAERDDVARPVAVKILRDAALSPARRARFLAERHTLAQLMHPAVAQLYDAGTLEDGTPWFAMEHVAGVPLDVYCTQHPLDLDARLALMERVCDAVQHAHEHAIVHRDLKPSNVLVTVTGEVKLLDFGIAKQLDAVSEEQGPARDAVTRSQLRLMTPAYAAPEQVRGETIGVYTDVYALGVMLYQLTAGRLPFDLSRSTPGEALTEIVEREPERVSAVAQRNTAAWVADVRRGQWDDLDLLCRTAMHKDAARRYRTVDALRRDLQHLRRGEPLEAHPDSLSYRAARFLRRRRQLVTLLGVVVLSLGAIGVASVRQITRARDAARAELHRRNELQQFLLALFSGNEHGAPPDSLRVLTVVERGERQAAMLERDPSVQGDLLVALARIQRALGRYDRADSLAQAGIVSLGRASDTLGIATALMTQADIRLEQALYPSADSLLDAALHMLPRNTTTSTNRSWLQGDRAAEVADAEARLQDLRGRRQVLQGHYDSARTTLDIARTRAQGRDADPMLVADILGDLADVAFYKGEHERADSLNRDVLARVQQHAGRFHPRVASTMVNIGATAFERGRYDEAERWFRDALAIAEQYFGTSHVQVASTRTMLGRALVYQNRLEEATEALQQALVVQEASVGRNHPSVASILNELGNVALRRGQLDSADNYFGRMAEVYSASNGDAHFTVAVALSNRGTVAMERKDLPAAERWFREVVQRFAAAQGAMHLNTGIARIKLGRALIRQRRWREGIAESEAGYEVVKAGAAPGVSFLQAARRDLAIAFDSLGQRETASRYRREAEQHDPPKP
ncbi:MAG TPA: serine/threonine-protein kinase [Gemmatimonas sp.]|uniref:serine/threonine-protein kinase n=1 Tax=Gemmatimonas sp. TaxID=1962908 RepID=UPI002EDA0DE7